MEGQSMPTPWSLKYDDAILDAILNAILDANGKDITSHSIQNCEANARLIVKAVNCHNELVEVLKQINRWLNGERFKDTYPVHCHRAIEQALTKVQSYEVKSV